MTQHCNNIDTPNVRPKFLNLMYFDKIGNSKYNDDNFEIYLISFHYAVYNKLI